MRVKREENEQNFCLSESVKCVDTRPIARRSITLPPPPVEHGPEPVPHYDAPTQD